MNNKQKENNNMSNKAEQAYEEYKAEEQKKGRTATLYARWDFLNGWNAAVEQALKEVNNEEAS
jgi:hypothetical protein